MPIVQFAEEEGRPRDGVHPVGSGSDRYPGNLSRLVFPCSMAAPLMQREQGSGMYVMFIVSSWQQTVAPIVFIHSSPIRGPGSRDISSECQGILRRIDLPGSVPRRSVNSASGLV